MGILCMNDDRMQQTILTFQHIDKIGKSWGKHTPEKLLIKMCVEFSEAQQERAKKLTSQKAFPKFQIMSHLEGTSVAYRNGLVGAKTFTGK